MNWGYRVLVLYILFIGMILTFVVISFTQTDIQLEDQNYYQIGVNYQDRIHQYQNANASGFRIVGEPKYDRLKLTLDQDDAIGTLKFFRHPDVKKVVELPFKPNEDGLQYIPLKGVLEKGLWKLKLSWKGGGKECYVEKSILITPKGEIEITDNK